MLYNNNVALKQKNHYYFNMPKRTKYDVEQIVAWLNEGYSWGQIDYMLGKTKGVTRRWLDTNGIKIFKTPSIFTYARNPK